MQPTKRVLIDDSLISIDGNRCKTYIEYFEQPQNIPQDTDRLKLELTYQNLNGITGYRLVEEESLPNGETKILQEYVFAPDIAYSLFKHWETLDDE